MESGSASTDEVPRPATGGWIFPALLAAVLVVSAVIALKGRPPGAPAPQGPHDTVTPSIPPQGETAALEIDFGNGVRKEFAALAWREGMTVADLLTVASEFRPGVNFTVEGSGGGGFLTSLDGVKNQGGSGRNWRYQVDGRHGEVSFSLQPLTPGARVLWEFTDEQ